MKFQLKILIILLTISIFPICSDTPKGHGMNQRYTFHKLNKNKILIIDQLTGSVAKYEFSDDFSSNSTTLLDIKWPNAKIIE